MVVKQGINRIYGVFGLAMRRNDEHRHFNSLYSHSLRFLTGFRGFRVRGSRGLGGLRV